MIKPSVFSPLFGLVFCVSANVSSQCSAMESDNNGLPVVVGFKMIRCGLFYSLRCPLIKVSMSSISYGLLGRPDSVKWNYTGNDVIRCLGAYAPVCLTSDEDHSVVGKFVYDSKRDEYYLVKRGQEFGPGLSFSLNSVCLRKGKDDNCEHVSLDASRSNVDFVSETIRFTPPDQLDTYRRNFLYQTEFAPCCDY